jgi:hypothetical protein
LWKTGVVNIDTAKIKLAKKGPVQAQAITARHAPFVASAMMNSGSRAVN